MNKNTLCFVAGRSGGHIVPALTHAQEAKRAHKDCSIIFFSTSTALDASIIKASPLIDFHIPLPLPGVPRNPLKIPLWISAFLGSCFTSLRTLRMHRPIKVVSMGGYISLPVCIAAWMLRIPVELHELNAVPGRATKVLARFATTIVVCFEEAQKYFETKKCVVAPYPVRFALENQITTQAALAANGFQPGRKMILIIGGSQGSAFINTIIKDWLSLNEYAHSLIQVIHQTGKSTLTDWNKLYQDYDIPAVTFEYCADMHSSYQAADLIICRSGAGSLFEALYFNKPIITIPLQTRTTAHQIDNAQAMAHRYPDLVTIIHEKEIRTNNTLFFKAMNTHIYAHQASMIKKSSQSDKASNQTL